MVGSAIVDKIDVANKCPHMTLLLKKQVQAVQSNYVLETILEHNPEIFKERKEKITKLNLGYKKS